LNHEIVYFNDYLCQMVDIFKPKNNIHFTLHDIMGNKHYAPVFFTFLTNLNKLVAYEQRDPFAIRNENQDFPDYSDWDKFARAEYIRLAVEDENQDNVRYCIDSRM